MTPMQQMLLGAGGRILTTWETNKPSWMPYETSVPAPYAWYDWENRGDWAGNGMNASNKWYDRSGNGRLSEISGGQRSTTGTGRNLSASVDCWHWPTTNSISQIKSGWPGNANVTMIHMTSYKASSGTDARMWQSNSPGGTNWFIGHWESGTGRYYMGNGFLEQNSDRGNVFLVHYAEITNNSDYGAGHIDSNGIKRDYTDQDGGNGDWPWSSVGISMNNGPYGEPSTGDCIFIGTWNNRLTTTQRDAVLTAAKNNFL